MTVSITNPRERKVVFKHLMSNVHNYGVHSCSGGRGKKGRWMEKGEGGNGGKRVREKRSGEGGGSGWK